VCLTGSWLGFLRVRLSASPEQGLFGGDIRIDGDMKTARSFQRLLDHLAIDWHGFLAGAIGSAPAAGLLELLGATRRWSADTGAALRQDAAEYLQEEVRALPSPAEGEEWLRAVDTLRADADRLEARIDRLRAASTPKS
jgi:ubiquinone biosynthesis protein UbiJ